jgi:hypothetical protein
MARDDSIDFRRVTLISVWLMGSIAVGGLLLRDLVYTQGFAIPRFGAVWGRDFANVWIGGRLALSGITDRLYDAEQYAAVQKALLGLRGEYNYSYPPFSLFFATPLALLPYPLAFLVWIVGTAALFAWAARPYVTHLPLALVILTPSATMNIWAGQYGFVIGALWLFSFRALAGRQAVGGLAAGLLAVKPHLALLLPAIFLYRRRFLTVSVALVVVAVAGLASAIVFGPSLWQEYVTRATSTQYAILSRAQDRFYFRLMPTTFVSFRYFSLGVAIVAQLVTAGLALAGVWKVRRAEWRTLAFVGATATFLILPYAFGYDMTVVSLGWVTLLHSRWNALTLSERVLLATAFVLPQAVLPLQSAHIPLAPFILLGAFWVQIRHAADDPVRDGCDTPVS